MKKALSLLLVLVLALAIFALPAAAQTHDHDGCAACAAESVILRRPPIIFCSYCGGSMKFTRKVGNQYLYACTNQDCYLYGEEYVGPSF